MEGSCKTCFVCNSAKMLGACAENRRCPKFQRKKHHMHGGCCRDAKPGKQVAVEVENLLDQPWSSRRRFEASNGFCKQSRRLAHAMHAQFFSLNPARKELQVNRTQFRLVPVLEWGRARRHHMPAQLRHIAVLIMMPVKYVCST